MSGVNLPAGTSTLDGEQALAFVRTRHGTADGSDLSRITLQQQFLAAAAGKVSSMGWSEGNRLGALVRVVVDTVTLDSSLAEPQQLLALADELRSLTPDRLTFVTVPWAPDPEDPNRVIPREPEAGTLFASLRL